MARTWWHSRSTWLALGLIAGLAVGGWWPQSPVHAVATDRYDNFAICTGEVEEGLEALFVLDFLTGEIKAGVLSPQNGRFTAQYTHNIIKDLGVEANQNPKYLMCTGKVAIQARGAGMNRGSSSALYVAELTTGRIAAYTLPWAGNTVAGGVVGAPFILLDVKQFRPNIIRPGGAAPNKKDAK
jgi:hypothetical protein